MEFAELIKTTRVDNVILRRQSSSLVEGTLCLTSHHLIFSSRVSEKDELMLLYMAIEDVQKKIAGYNGTINIICKDFTSFKLRIPGAENCLNVAASIEALSTLENQTWYYPFFHRLDFIITENGWDAFSPEVELKNLIDGSDSWRICSLNNEFKISLSYPELNIVPKAVTDDLILKSSYFRFEGRFPILAFLNRKNKVPLLRSSQPQPGHQGKRCKEDEKFLSTILQGHSKKGFIFDTRSRSVISAHKSKGGGSESESKYPQWKRVILGIDQYISLPDSIGKLHAACADKKTGAWLSNLESSGWLTTVEAVLTAAVKIAEQIDTHDTPVLVHEDNGMDITLVLTSLVQILLNPESRTIRGLQSLIVREWLWAGHPFASRNMKLGVSLARYKGQGSVFLLFLDTLHQIISQYPSSFEYGEDLLCFLSFHSYASPYGTFLFNNESERKREKVSSKTISVWSYLNQPKILQSFVNPLYEYNDGPLWPSVAPPSLNIWSLMFLKWAVSSTPRKKVQDQAVKMKEQNTKLKEQAYQLQREYLELQKEIVAIFGGENDEKHLSE